MMELGGKSLVELTKQLKAGADNLAKASLL